MATQITPLPTPPSRQDPASFSSRADTFLGQLPAFATEANALAVFTETKANEAEQQVALAENQVILAEEQVALATNQAGLASTAATVATGAANYKGEYAAGTTYTQGQSVSYNGARFVAKKTNLGITPINGNDWLKLPSPEIIREARTSNTALSSSDFGKLIDITSGTFTQTFNSASSLGNGWWCYIRNSGTGDITLDPNNSETIDGLTSYVMYPGEVRLVQCDGTALWSVVLNAFYKVFTVSGTFVKPPGYMAFEGLMWGAGGSGQQGASLSDRWGGGGGACSPFRLHSTSLGVSTAVTIGAGGGSQYSPSSTGIAGGNSTFSVISAGGGKGGAPSQVLGGGSYGIFSNPAVSANNPDNYLAGGWFSANTVYGGAGGQSIGNNNQVTYFPSSIFGGAGGTTNAAGTTPTAGSAPGGGGGASINGTPSGAGARGELRIWGVI